MFLSGCVCYEEDWRSSQRSQEKLSQQITEAPILGECIEEDQEHHKADLHPQDTVFDEKKFAAVEEELIPVVKKEKPVVKIEEVKVEPSEPTVIASPKEEKEVLEVIVEEEPPVVIAKKEEPVIVPKPVVPTPVLDPYATEKEFFERWSGECLIYNVNWNFMKVGKALVASKKAKNNYGDIYHLVAVTVPEGVLANMNMGYYRIDAYIDRETLLPCYYYQYTKNRDKEDILDLYFNKNSDTYRWRLRKYRKGKIYSTKTQTVKLTNPAYDGISSFYMVRTLDFNTKRVFTVPVVLREMWDLIINRKSRAKKNIPNYGVRDIFIVEPQAKSDAGFFTKGKMDIWITADNKRVPVYLESKVPLGTAKFSLASEFNIGSNTNFDAKTISKLLSRVK